MTSGHSKPIDTYHSHEYTSCTLNQCENQHFNSHGLLWVFDTVGKSSMGFSIGILNSPKCTSHPLDHVLLTDKPTRQLSTARWGSSRDRLTLIDSAFEFITGLRREHWKWGPECVDVAVSYECVRVGNVGAGR